MWNARNLVRTSLAPFVYIFLTVQLDTNEKIVLGKFETFRFPLCLPSCLSVFVSFGFNRKFLHIFFPLLVLRLLLSDWESCLAGKHSWSWEAMTLAHPPRLQRHQNKYQNSDITPVLFEMTFPLFNFVLYLPKVFFS